MFDCACVGVMVEDACVSKFCLPVVQVRLCRKSVDALSQPSEVCVVTCVMAACSMRTNAADRVPEAKRIQVRAYSDFAIRGLRLQGVTHYLAKPPREFVVVTWMSRQSSVAWPEARFCDDAAYWKCSLFAHLKTRALSRVIKNEEDVVKRLKELDLAVSDGSRRVFVHTKDFNVLTLREQVACAAKTDVMVGPHGAGLTHTLFMPDRAHLVEVFVDGSTGLEHFNNMHAWRHGKGKHKYSSIPNAANPVDVDKVFQVVHEAVTSLDLDAY